MKDTIPTPRTDANTIWSHACIRGHLYTTVEFSSELERENIKLREALVKLRDCDWTITLPDRMDAVRDIAREALKGIES
jgi:hypothetical protein